jgi:hypothetical protein
MTGKNCAVSKRPVPQSTLEESTQNVFVPMPSIVSRNYFAGFSHVECMVKIANWHKLKFSLVHYKGLVRNSCKDIQMVINMNSAKLFGEIILENDAMPN